MKRNDAAHRLGLLAVLIGGFAAAGCSSNGGTTTPALQQSQLPSAGTTVKAPTVSTSPLPPGTVAVTLSIQIPKRKPSSVHLRPTEARRAPAYIGSNTTNISATVTVNTIPTTYPGSCTTSVCTLTIPIGIGVMSDVAVQILDGNAIIGDASTAFNTTPLNAVTEGSSTSVTLTFVPRVAAIELEPPNPAPTFGPQTVTTALHFVDPSGNDIASETDGMSDSLGTAISMVTLTGSIGITFPAAGGSSVYTFPPAGYLALTAAYDGTAYYPPPYPDVVPSVTGGQNVQLFSMSQAASALAVTPSLKQYSTSSAAYNAGSDTFTVSDDIGNATTGITVSTSPGCSNITNYTGGTYPYFGPVTFTVPYNYPPFNGKCILTIADTESNSVTAEIDVTNPTITIESSKRK